jgi:hypothetical protein
VITTTASKRNSLGVRPVTSKIEQARSRCTIDILCLVVSAEQHVDANGTSRAAAKQIDQANFVDH